MSKVTTYHRRKPAPKVRLFPRLNDKGEEVLSEHNLVRESVFRPPTLQEQIRRLESAGKIARGFLPDDDYADDDFGDDFDDLPEEGLSPYEMSEFEALQKRVRELTEKGNPKQATPPAKPSVPPPAEPGSSGGEPS